jgi:selenide,water dikinase
MGFPYERQRPPRGRRPLLVRGEEKGMDLSGPPFRPVVADSSLCGTTFGVVSSTVPLTSLARAGGCAAKYAAARLETLLAGIVPAEAEDLLVGLDPADDAAVYRLDDDRAIVFTVDFFPPLVDDPRVFGGIAATNALNDVFAMGGSPLLALSVAAFPEELPVEVLGDILSGADEQVRNAGAILAGGHTIRDDEPKYGLAVVGTVHPEAIWPKAGGRAGDALYVTKPLGTGIVLQAHRERKAPEGALESAIQAMLELNRAAADALRPFAPNAVTDVTGFGLLGHVHELASRSGVRAVVDADALPGLPGALELAEAGVRTGGDRRNREFAGPHVESDVDGGAEILAYDPQTAGGLLIALPKERGAVLEATFASQGLFLRRIGDLVEGGGVLFR